MVHDSKRLRSLLRRSTLEPLEQRRLLAVQHVVQISVDGLGGYWLEPLLRDARDNATGEFAAFLRLQSEGSSTLNARTDVTHTTTLPNHTSMITGRPVLAPPGASSQVAHQWTGNTDPLAGVTLHSNQPAAGYIASALDVVHDHGGSTAMLAGKSKFSLFDVSYDSAHGAQDANEQAGDNGRDKLDWFRTYGSGGQLVADFKTTPAARLSTFAFVHFAEPDGAGHGSGWGSAAWVESVKVVDGYLGQLFQVIDTDPALRGNTAIVLTADHGGKGTTHDQVALREVYQIPFFLWGPGIPAGADLYQVFGSTTVNPVDGRPDYNASPPPIRNGDAGNLVLDLLGLPPIPGSTIVSLHSCARSTPSTCAGDNEPVDTFDYGDAPAPFPTTKRRNCAEHRIVAGFYLGSRVDEESDGVPSAAADGDDRAADDDEDGVELASPLVRGEATTVHVTASQAGILQAWFDWNGDGDWNDTQESVFVDYALSPGLNSRNLSVPADSQVGNIIARFRLAHEKFLTATGSAESGEVEDYQFEVRAQPQVDILAARDDRFQVPRDSGPLPLAVLANDSGQTIRLRSVDRPNQGGTAVLNNGRTAVIYTPRAGVVGTEQFVYTIEDQSGATASAWVRIEIVPPDPSRELDRVGIVVAAEDQAGQSLPGVRLGQRFWIAVYVQDQSPVVYGVQSAWFDLHFDQTSARRDGPVEHGPNYRERTSGQASPGELDEAGGQTSSAQLDGGSHLLFRAPFRAHQLGPLTFELQPADDVTHAVRTLGGQVIPPDRWTVQSLSSFAVLPPRNETLPEDVDDDDVISPRDALLVINDLNRWGAGSLDERTVLPSYWVDVNGDGWLSAIDALLVINYLNARSTLANARPAEAREVETPLVVSRAAIAAAVDDIFAESGSPRRQRQPGTATSQVRLAP